MLSGIEFGQKRIKEIRSSEFRKTYIHIFIGNINKAFIDYIGEICTKKEDTVVKGTKMAIKRQRYWLTKQEKEKVY